MWFQTSGVPLFDQKGNLIGFRGADTDITERKLFEEKLKENEIELEERASRLLKPALFIEGEAVYRPILS